MTDKPTVVEALTAVMSEVQSVGKGQRNTEQGYNFRGVDAVVNAVGPVLRKHGVVVLPLLEKASYRDVTTSRGKPSRESTVEVRYRFYGPGGDFIEAVVPGEAMDFGDKGVAKAMSVAYRIVLLQALCIPTDESDPDSQTYERAYAWEEPAVKPPTPEQVANYDKLHDHIASASTPSEFVTIWGLIVSQFKAEDITTVQANALRAEVARRKEEVNGTADGTGDSDGGGAEPGPTGEGPGPDGPGAGVGGPGGDTETGGVRPGVQSGVHRRPGVGGSAQASRDRRGAPAATGG